jgi:uncharacterized protein (TIGR03000 family)
MTRAVVPALTLAALVAFAAGAGAQQKRLPLAPGVRPGGTGGPGTHLVAPAPRFAPTAGMTGNAGGKPRAAAGANRAGVGRLPGGAFAAPGGFGGPILGLADPPLQFYEPGFMIANEYPATLTIQLPTTSRMWVEGKPLVGEVVEEYVLTSPDLAYGERFTFAVRVRWTRDGKTYEANRTVKLAQGDRGRLTILSGDEVKE